MGLKPILAVKPINLTQPNKQHKKYSYKLRGINIVRANQVWSTDITYIKIGGGMVYLAAVIDWYSKAVLSWKISWSGTEPLSEVWKNTMDTQLVTSVLNEALSLHGKPEIFNTEEKDIIYLLSSSQYTSYAHTQILKDNNITISMDGKGEKRKLMTKCHKVNFLSTTDNICIERFWRGIKEICDLISQNKLYESKVERIYLNEYKSIKELKEDTKDYIDFYNNKRFHRAAKQTRLRKTLDYKKPMNVYYDSLKINDKNYNKLSGIVA